MSHRSASLRLALVALVLVAAATRARADEEFCAALDRVVASATNEEPFAAVSGADAGTHIQAAQSLPGAKFCFVRPADSPPTYRCLLTGEDRYQATFQKLAKQVERIEDCLGDGWTRGDTENDAYLRAITLSRDDGVELLLLATKMVAEDDGWKRYRIVLILRAPSA